MSINKARNENDKAIRLADCLNKLALNPDFQLLFTQYYCTERVLDLTDQLAMYENNSVDYLACVDELRVISCFKQFLQTVKDNGAMALTNNLELMTILDESEYND